MSNIQYGNKKIAFEIIRGNREKTVAIYVNSPAGVVVRSPEWVGEEKINKLIQKRAAWIVKRQELFKNQIPPATVKEFVSGESFPFLGREYRLKVVKSTSEKEGRCELRNKRFQVEINLSLDSGEAEKTIKRALMDWYLMRAKEKIQARVAYFSRQIGRTPKSIAIKQQKMRWGSCSQSEGIRFNWKIIMAPLSVLDYVIVHELCHLIYPHHSSQFWQKVQSILPDYKRRKEWLKRCSYSLDGLG
jgi:predicted metal-dependent hydrolase